MVVAGHALIRDGLACLLDASPDVAAVVTVDSVDEITARVRALDNATAVICGAPGELLGDLEVLGASARGLSVLAVTTDSGSQFVRAAFAAGAAGVIGTVASRPDLVDALRALGAGGSYLHPTLGAALAQVESTRPVDELSHREREVLRLIALGMTNPEIAHVLVVSTRTVETHRAHLARKLRAQSRADLVQHALRGGLLTVE